MFLLADYFLENFDLKLDRMKVYQLITYHDLLEYKIGDIPLISQTQNSNKHELESAALAELKNELNGKFGKYIVQTISEYEKRESLESRFVKAVDFIDNEFTCLAYGYQYKKFGYSIDFLKNKFIEKVNTTKEITDFYFDLLAYIESKGMFKE